jgi:hypothetical protein
MFKRLFLLFSLPIILHAFSSYAGPSEKPGKELKRVEQNDPPVPLAQTLLRSASKRALACAWALVPIAGRALAWASKAFGHFLQFEVEESPEWFIETLVRQDPSLDPYRPTLARFDKRTQMLFSRRDDSTEFRNISGKCDVLVGEIPGGKIYLDLLHNTITLRGRNALARFRPQLPGPSTAQGETGTSILPATLATEESSYTGKRSGRAEQQIVITGSRRELLELAESLFTGKEAHIDPNPRQLQ